ncbi:hypothetical protein ON010_g987 [Phytophthora cinnamomi]|nr:hypothetical protein ON010_g987 [Phytophthora cinnamomi]
MEAEKRARKARAASSSDTESEPPTPLVAAASSPSASSSLGKRAQEESLEAADGKKPRRCARGDHSSADGRGAGAAAAASPAEDAKEDAARRVETATRSSERLSRRQQKRKTREDDKADAPRDKKKAKVVINTLDPIMLAELGPHTVRYAQAGRWQKLLLLYVERTDSIILGNAVGGQFEFTRTNGSVVVYNVESLVQYILATGDFSEPETRIPFSDEDLRRIDVEASKGKLNEKSVVDAKKNKHTFEEQKVKRDGILGEGRRAALEQLARRPGRGRDAAHNERVPVVLGHFRADPEERLGVTPSTAWATSSST